MERNSERRYTLDEYFEVEEASKLKNEYYDGQIFAMAGASLRHNRIARNVLTFLGTALANRGCEVFGSDLRVQTPGGLFTYPDISVVCGEPLLIQGRPDTVTNPIALVEVLSDATREYDRGQKLALYQQIPTLREYMLIEQELPLVEAFHSDGRNWVSRTYDSIEGAVSLEALNLEIPITEIYRLVAS